MYLQAGSQGPVCISGVVVSHYFLIRLRFGLIKFRVVIVLFVSGVHPKGNDNAMALAA
jgi:hypothetical protein